MKFTKGQIVLGVIAIAMVMFLTYTVGANSVEPQVITEVQESIKYVEVAPEQKFDTSVLEEWDGDFSDGKIRMIGAWLYGEDKNGAPIVVDEKGELWTLVGYEVESEDFMLLWIADNNTPNNSLDDSVLKIWIEKYESPWVGEVG